MQCPRQRTRMQDTGEELQKQDFGCRTQHEMKEQRQDLGCRSRI